MEIQKPRITKEFLRKKNGTGAINLPDFTLYLKTIVIKTVQHWHKDRNIDQWNKIESPEISPCNYGHLAFHKEGNNINGENTIPLKSGAGKTGQPFIKE